VSASERSLRIASSSGLVDGGRGVRFESGGGPCFALRFEGRVVAYRNACPHTGGELDWNEGDFLDDERRLVVCATHGALFEPASGRCVAGPCRGATLEAVAVFDDGESVVAAE
jgi:nitrite reductase/ring-hydroxylating ferredoxin subunit